MPRLPWPLPAVLAWAAAWGVHGTAVQLGWPQPVPLALASGVGLGMSLLGRGWWRRLLIAAGFPLAMLATGLVVAPAWVWLLLLALLLLVYPINAWRDAPLFPTPARALERLPEAVPLPAGAQVLDAGCGLGQGLRALHAAYPQATLHGIERSWPLRLWCGWRCPWARVRQGDMWAGHWGEHAMVYLFQRPESMARAMAKARAEMVAGSWLVSLEFEAAGHVAHAAQSLDDGRMLWIYRMDGIGKSAVGDSA